MPKTFEMLNYLDHLRLRWRVMAVACGAAIAVALGAALVTPAQYTATARVVIEPPAGSDPRGATAVSPIYLESLKSYELLASGDRLFLEALDHFKVPRSKSIESLKRSVLKVSVARNTKVLEISATVHEPAQAQALALYIAEQTVKLARRVSAETDEDLLADARRQLDEAQAHLRQEAPESVQAASSAGSDPRDARRDAAREAVYLAAEHLAQVRGMMGARGDRLEIVDSGVVPERPSWPNIPVMLGAALLLAMVGSLVFVTFEFNYRIERSAAPRAVAPLARVKTRND
jgi:uncharacterized protein involved in exopolysaccharide biosynthesis